MDKNVDFSMIHIILLKEKEDTTHQKYKYDILENEIRFKIWQRKTQSFLFLHTSKMLKGPCV